VDPSYIAGFFDGEGSIGVYYHVNRGVQTGFHLRVQLRQNKTDLSLRLFDELVARYGGCVSEFSTRSDKKGLNWQIGSSMAVGFLREIEPHLILKKDQARLAVSWQEGRIPAFRDERGRISSYSKGVREHDLAVSNALKLMKSGSSTEAVVGLQGDLVDLVGRFTPKIVRMDGGG
jgi:hypothetical protein